MPRSASYRATLCRPESTTAVTPGTVTDVSAMLVATITRRRGRRGRSAGVLLGAIQRSVKRHDVDVGRPAERRSSSVDRPPDFERAREKTQDVSRRAPNEIDDRVGHRLSGRVF